MGGLTDFGAAGKTGTLHHGKHIGGDVAVHDSVVVKVAAVAVHIALHAAIYVHLTGTDVALDVGKLTNGHLTGIGKDFTVDFAVDVHVVLERDGTDNLDTLGENVSRIGAHDVFCYTIVDNVGKSHGHDFLFLGNHKLVHLLDVLVRQLLHLLFSLAHTVLSEHVVGLHLLDAVHAVFSHATDAHAGVL